MDVLIDSDVILDFFFDRRPFSEYAEHLLALCEERQVNAWLTPVICSNVYYLLCRTSSREKVKDRMKQLLEIIDVLNMDREVVHAALRSGFKDFEDAMQNASAEHSGFVSLIITRNVKDYTRSSLGVMNPETFLKTMDLQ